MLEAQWAKGNFVCVGLDSDIDEVLKHLNKGEYLETMCEFNRSRIKATRDLVCAFKINTAFYESRGSKGWFALEETVRNIHNLAPDVPVILDAKHADIDNTNIGYAYMAFEFLKVDAITVHPYLGAEALKPFLEYKNKGIIVLCRTSNPGAGEFQDLPIQMVNGDLVQLYKIIARQIAKKWNKNGNCAIVVGATYPNELREVRKIVGDMPILIPGVGFQQKDVPLEEQVKQVVDAGKDSRGWGMIINSSRGIIFSDDPRREIINLRNLINQYR